MPQNMMRITTFGMDTDTKQYLKTILAHAKSTATTSGAIRTIVRRHAELLQLQLAAEKCGNALALTVLPDGEFTNPQEGADIATLKGPVRILDMRL